MWRWRLTRSSGHDGSSIHGGDHCRGQPPPARRHGCRRTFSRNLRTSRGYSTSVLRRRRGEVRESRSWGTGDDFTTSVCGGLSEEEERGGGRPFGRKMRGQYIGSDEGLLERSKPNESMCAWEKIDIGRGPGMNRPTFSHTTGRGS